MATINNIKKRADEIKNAYEPESVTAEKVGQLFEDIADITEQTITSSEEVMQESVRAATQAAQAAEDASGYLSDLQDAIQDLPDGQAVSAEVAINKTDIAGLKSTLNGGQGIDYSDTDIHAYINNSGQLASSNTSDCTDYIAVEEGENFKYGGITGEGLSPVYGYSDTSGNGYQALVSPTGNTYKETVFAIPSGISYIRAWSRNSSHSSTPSSLKLIDITNSTGLEQRVESLESAIVDVEGEIIDYSETNIHAYLNNGEAVSSNTSDCTDYIAVEEGETFKYGGVTGEGLSPVYGYSNNSGGNPQALVNPTGNTYKETEITIPNSVSYIRAWSRNGRHTTTPSALKMIKIIHKGVDEKLNELNYRVSELEEGQTESVNIPQSFNGYPLPYRPQTLKILSVGNSFIQYPLLALTSYLSALGITNVVYGCIAKGACTLAMFKQNLANNTKDLSFQLSVNGNAFKYYDAETGEEVQGSGDAIYCSCLKDAFAYDKWDIITFQQESSNSGKWNTIEPNIGDIIQGARYYCPNAGVKIAWHQTWAYANGFTERLVNYGGSQEKMFNAIVEVSKSIVTKFDVDLIIPSGVILQSIRGISNSFWGADKDTIKGADTYSAGNPQSDFTIDGYHPNPFAVYALCGGLVQLLINSCLGKTIRGCTATYQTAVGDYAKVARQAALKCIGSRYSIVAIDTTNLE